MATNYTFDSASFVVLATKPDGNDITEVTETHIPGGSVNYIEIGGRTSNHIDLSIYFDAASGYVALRGLVGSSAMLRVPSGSYANTVLVSLQRTFLNVNGVQSICDVSFIAP